jgi:hypothetical protein
MGSMQVGGLTSAPARMIPAGFMGKRPVIVLESWSLGLSRGSYVRTFCEFTEKVQECQQYHTACFYIRTISELIPEPLTQPTPMNAGHSTFDQMVLQCGISADRPMWT